jgi:hypothetical protein
VRSQSLRRLAFVALILATLASPGGLSLDPGCALDCSNEQDAGCDASCSSCLTCVVVAVAPPETRIPVAFPFRVFRAPPVVSPAGETASDVFHVPRLPQA